MSEAILGMLVSSVRSLINRGMKVSKTLVAEKLVDTLLQDERFAKAIAEIQKNDSLDHGDENLIRKAFENQFSINVEKNSGAIQNHTGSGDNNANFS